MFSGSFLAEDVTFLLKPVQLAPIAVQEKERLIQSGRRHYSEMISPERLPSPAYLAVFQQALSQEKERFSRDLLILAQHLANCRSEEIVLVSLARAGTPIGVLLGRILRQLLGRQAVHYSLSIIRDRGIDENALLHLLDQYPSQAIVFIDGWTGKGVIAAELRRAISQFNSKHATALDPGLFTVADLCGVAAFAATSEDYLIPSSILGATISGLISRSILNDQVIQSSDFHGCLYYQEFAQDDRSRQFADEVFAEIRTQWQNGRFGWPGFGVTPEQCTVLREISDHFLAAMMERFEVRNVNYIKPGLGETTRVLLRRVPDRVLVRDLARREVTHLLYLAREKNVPITVDPGLPYTAAALIKELED